MRRRRIRRILLPASLSVLVALLLLEGGVRFLLFSDSTIATTLGSRFRGAGRYASTDTDDYWNLRVRMAPRRALGSTRVLDPRLGWRDVAVSESYEHVAAHAVGDRRPLLLYGDSFARCTTPPEDCFDGLFERSEHARSMALLNYAVGGYGLDQIYLMLEASIDHHVGQAPFVIVGILVDDDLNRSLLSFREWPRPRLHTRDGELVPPAPLAPSVDAWIEQNPVGIRSYLWRRVVVGSDLLPEGLRSRLNGDRARREELRTLNRAILVAVRGLLEERDLPYFVLVFHGFRFLEESTPPWQEAFLLETLAELGMPYVLSRTEILADAERTGRAVRDYFGQEGIGRGHYTPYANEVVFRTLERGLGGEFDAP